MRSRNRLPELVSSPEISVTITWPPIAAPTSLAMACMAGLPLALAVAFHLPPATSAAAPTATDETKTRLPPAAGQAPALQFIEGVAGAGVTGLAHPGPPVRRRVGHGLLPGRHGRRPWSARTRQLSRLCTAILQRVVRFVSDISSGSSRRQATLPRREERHKRAPPASADTLRRRGAFGLNRNLAAGN
jgi:hypothetical protein